LTPLELTGAFGVLAAGGVRATPHAVRVAVGPGGDVVAQPAQAAESVYAASETFLVTSALQGAVERGTGRGLRGWGYEGPIAAKSGTSNDFRDAWFVGYTPALALGVWVGFDDGQSLGLSGAQAALPIFARFLNATRAGPETGDFTPPRELEVVSVNPNTGFAADEECGGETEYFLPGTGPAVGDGCWSEVPRWIAEAGSKAIGGIRSFLERLFGRGRGR
jgi:membrane carboxypeptidase/penicillin-binding protein